MQLLLGQSSRMGKGGGTFPGLSYCLNEVTNNSLTLVFVVLRLGNIVLYKDSAMVVIDAIYRPLTLSLWFDKLTMSDLLITLTLSLSKGKLTTNVITGINHKKRYSSS